MWEYAASSFYSENNWFYPATDFKTEIYFSGVDLYYSTYWDLDSLTMTAGFWFEGELQSTAKWNFKNTVWDHTGRFEDEIAEHDETVKDPWTNIEITDYSNDWYVRDYSLYINDTVLVHDQV